LFTTLLASETNARVEVDIGLVHVKNLFLGAGVGNQSGNVLQDFTSSLYRNSQCGPGSTKATFFLEKHLT